VNFDSTGSNQFLIRARGGLGINTNNPNGAALAVHGTVAASGFAGDGSGLVGLNASQLSGTINSAQIAAGAIQAADVNAATFNTTFWRSGGNSGTTPGTHFMGTTDDQPLEFKVYGQRVLRLEPNVNSPNVIGGFSGNFVGGEFMARPLGVAEASTTATPFSPTMPPSRAAGTTTSVLTPSTA